jgi:hypothetical protein
VEKKIGLVYSNSLPGGTVVIRILRFFVALYLLFLPSHRYTTKQNCSCQLLLNVRMQYDCFTQCQNAIWFLYTMPEANKFIDTLHSECSFGRVIREIQVNSQCGEIAHLV